MDYKPGLEGLQSGQFKGFQIRAKRLQIGAGVLNWGTEISNRGRDCKSGQERLQTGAWITNRCRT